MSKTHKYCKPNITPRKMFYAVQIIYSSIKIKPVNSFSRIKYIKEFVSCSILAKFL